MLAKGSILHYTYLMMLHEKESTIENVTSYGRYQDDYPEPSRTLGGRTFCTGAGIASQLTGPGLG